MYSLCLYFSNICHILCQHCRCIEGAPPATIVYSLETVNSKLIACFKWSQCHFHSDMTKSWCQTVWVLYFVISLSAFTILVHHAFRLIFATVMDIIDRQFLDQSGGLPSNNFLLVFHHYHLNFICIFSYRWPFSTIDFIITFMFPRIYLLKVLNNESVMCCWCNE